MGAGKIREAKVNIPGTPNPGMNLRVKKSPEGK